MPTTSIFLNIPVRTGRAVLVTTCAHRESFLNLSVRPERKREALESKDIRANLHIAALRLRFAALRANGSGVAPGED